jgi:hypothetical protein
MNISETINYLGQVNSRKCYPKEFNEINTELPYFKVSDNNDIQLYNYKTHDNAPRMPYVTDYLKYNVFPYIKKKLSGYYNIQLHDTYTYLDDELDYKDVLTFGKAKSDNGPIMLPDCYFLGNWGNKYVNFKDDNTWDQKLDKIIFAGSTTGNRNPRLNNRINTCLWSIDKPYCDFYITNIVQMSPIDVYKNIPNINKVLRSQVSLEQQLKYKFMLLIDGNTNKWTCDSFFSKSLSMMMPTNDMLWYYSLLQDGEHFINIDYDNMNNTFNHYLNNPLEADRIINNANKLSNKLFNAHVCQKYLIALFEAIADNK